MARRGRQGAAWIGWDWQGRHGAAGKGMAWLGAAGNGRHGGAGRGQARRGAAWTGEAGRARVAERKKVAEAETATKVRQFKSF